MIRATTFAGQSVAVFGLGRSGIATGLSLLAGGARVAAWDDAEAGRRAAQAAGLPVVDLATADWSAYSALVLAPGVPLTHPKPHWTVEKAEAAGVPVIGDTEIFFRERAAREPGAVVIAITGTNGKSTTTALVAHLLAAAGRDVAMGGNIGTAVLSLPELAAERIYVLEMSSFQIDLTPTLNPSVGVLLNVTPDHLDRHGPADDPALAMRNYTAVKERLVAEADLAVVGVGSRAIPPPADDPCERIAARYEAMGRKVLVFTRARERLGVCVVARRTEIMRLSVPGDAVTIVEELASVAGIPSLRGHHNVENAAVAYMVCEHLGLSQDDIQSALTTFPGLPHRMEEIGRRGSVLFINDSKATNADSTEKALAAFPGGIYWILGGLQKEGGIEGLRAYFPRIAKAYLIGKAADTFAATLGDAVPFERSETLEAAVSAAARDAAAGAASSGALEPVVLLSPACASYDQFPNFEVRGRRFTELVAALPGMALRGKSGADGTS